MNQPVILIGIGEMGGVFARGLLRAGYPVVPVVRGRALDKVQSDVPDPEAVVVAVAEKDLDAVLQSLPNVWHDRVVLLQNELLPKDWEAHRLKNPTVISVWFEKKYPNDYKPLVPSPVSGPKAGLIKTALESLKIPCRVLKTSDELLFELVLKNLYILTTNIAGFQVGGNVGTLWKDHRPLAREIAGEVMDIQFRLIERELDRDKLIEAMAEVFAADPDHKCMGRSAPARLERALRQADEAGLEVARLRAMSVR